MMDTLLIEGLELPDVCLEWPYEWPYQGNNEAGDVVTYPGIDGGSSSSDPPYPPKVLSVPLTIANDGCDYGDDAQLMAHANARWRAVVAACLPGRNVELTRRMTLPAAVLLDPPVALDTTSLARYVGIITSRPTLDVWRAVVEFMLLDGVWYGPEADVFALAAGTDTLTMEGDTRTHRMTITFNSGASPVLTNLTNGSSVTYAGTPAGATIDVSTMQVTGGDASLFSWTRRLPFRLEPGPNLLSLSSGSVVITPTPAYL